MSILTIYLIGVLLTALTLTMMAPPAVESVRILVMALMFPLTWVVLTALYIRTMTNPEFAEYVRHVRNDWGEERADDH